MGWPFGYSENYCSKLLLMKDFIPFLSSCVHSLTPHMHFFHFNDTCYLGFNGSTIFLESTIAFDSFWRTALELVLECYVPHFFGTKV